MNRPDPANTTLAAGAPATATATAATDHQRRARVRALYRAIAPRYDLLNTLVTCGLDRMWRDRTAALADPKPSQRWLDLGCGTGEMARVLYQREPAIQMTCLDLTPAMLEAARRRLSVHRYPRVRFVEGSALELPWPAGEFDGVVSAFALRPLPDLPAVLAEAARVLKSGGRFAALEALMPRRPRPWTRFYYYRWVPWLGGRFSSGAAYRFLPRSLALLPPPDGLVRLLEAAGFARAEVVRLRPGSAVVLVGVKN